MSHSHELELIFISLGPMHRGYMGYGYTQISSLIGLAYVQIYIESETLSYYWQCKVLQTGMYFSTYQM